MEFSVLNAANLDYPSNCFHCIIDKCTLDSVLCGENSFQRALVIL